MTGMGQAVPATFRTAFGLELDPALKSPQRGALGGSVLQQANLLVSCGESLCVFVRQAFGVRRIPALFPRGAQGCLRGEGCKAPGYGALL